MNYENFETFNPDGSIRTFQTGETVCPCCKMPIRFILKDNEKSWRQEAEYFKEKYFKLQRFLNVLQTKLPEFIWMATKQESDNK